MRFVVPALAAVLLAVLPAAAEENLLGPAPGASPRAAPGDDGNRSVRPAVPESHKAVLDDLFVRLAAAGSAGEARPIEQQIFRIWNASGSATVDLFMGWADQALGEKNFPRALDLLDQIVILKPDFAEGYNRRATVYYMTDDYKHALADIRTTLALEPRHFGALSGLGAILTEIGDGKRAEVVYRKALALNPNLDSVREQLDKLEKADRGSPI